MCGDLSALKKPEMRIFHWFSFPNFPLVWLSPLPFLGSISMFKTFLHAHLCMVTFLHLESRDANFLLIQFSELSIGCFPPSPILGSVSTFKTFMLGHLWVVTCLHLETRDANFPLIQCSELSFGSVFPVTHPRFHFNVLNIYVWWPFCTQKTTEMQIFHWFSFLNFPLVQFSPSIILGSISMFRNLCIDIYAWWPFCT